MTPFATPATKNVVKVNATIAASKPGSTMSLPRQSRAAEIKVTFANSVLLPTWRECNSGAQPVFHKAIRVEVAGAHLRRWLSHSGGDDGEGEGEAHVP
jgi:hypothetical protein